MATFKPIVRGMRKDGFLQVYIRVTHHKRHGYIKTDKVVTKQMVKKHGNINVLHICVKHTILYSLV